MPTFWTTLAQIHEEYLKPSSPSTQRCFKQSHLPCFLSFIPSHHRHHNTVVLFVMNDPSFHCVQMNLRPTRLLIPQHLQCLILFPPFSQTDGHQSSFGNLAGGGDPMAQVGGSFRTRYEAPVGENLFPLARHALNCNYLLQCHWHCGTWMP